MSSLRTYCATAIITLFVSFFFFSGLRNALNVQNVFPLAGLTITAADDDDFLEYSPDLYTPIRTLTQDDLALDRPNRRVFIVGDIHGSRDALFVLLKRVSYNSSLDRLLHTGDLVAKSGVDSSLSSLDYFTRFNVTGPLGNHDDKVLRWRQWIDWVRKTDEGERWLKKMEKRAKKELKIYMDDKRNGNALAKWRIPEGWKFGAEHYWIAKKMTRDHYRYLKSLPLTVHIPSLHTYIVHAGLLPADPTKPPFAPHQPLANIPKLPGKSNESDIRRTQELALLNQVPQNANPWVLTNMRSLTERGQVSKENDGIPWSDLWASIMDRCEGYRGFETREPKKKNGGKIMKVPEEMIGKTKLPCKPTTIIYGHAASRGLDIKRWSMGLDTGCVYGKMLTTLVLSSESQLNDLDTTLAPSISTGEFRSQRVEFGETGQARIVSVRCPD